MLGLAVELQPVSPNDLEQRTPIQKLVEALEYV
jgi:hypothetical protein